MPGTNLLAACHNLLIQQFQLPLLHNWQKCLRVYLNTSTLYFLFFPSLPLSPWIRRHHLFYPAEHFLKLMRSYCIKYRRNSLPPRGKIQGPKKQHTTGSTDFSAEIDDNLIIVLNTCLGYVKRHKSVESHLKSRSIVLPLTKPIFSCIFDKIPTSPCLLQLMFS